MCQHRYRESIVLALQGNDILGKFLRQSGGTSIELGIVVLFSSHLGYFVISNIVCGLLVITLGPSC